MLGGLLFQLLRRFLEPLLRVGLLAGLRGLARVLRQVARFLCRVLLLLRERVARTFRRSLQIRHLDVGSSNGCDWEINALLNPVYDLQRFGIDFVASPRHADRCFGWAAARATHVPRWLA